MLARCACVGGRMASHPHGPGQDEATRRTQILERLLLTKRPQLLRQVRRHSERPDDADDALADACVQFLRHYTGPADGCHALHWMLMVSKRCAWQIARRRRRRDDLAPTVPLDEAVEIELSPGDAAEQIECNEEADEVMKAIELLTPDQRSALILFGLGFSYEEIGRLRGWNRAKVNRCLSEGRARVRRMLGRAESS